MKFRLLKKRIATGVSFEEQTVDSMARAILAFESCEQMFLPDRIQSHARRFDTSIFIGRMRDYINSVLTKPAHS